MCTDCHTQKRILAHTFLVSPTPLFHMHREADYQGTLTVHA